MKELNKQMRERGQLPYELNKVISQQAEAYDLASQSVDTVPRQLLTKPPRGGKYSTPQSLKKMKKPLKAPRDGTPE